ncbi:MAG: alpha/beta fold hydrolase [Myxococcota bacterium]
MSTAPEVPERLSRERRGRRRRHRRGARLRALQEITERIGRSEGRTGDETSERYWAHHRRRMTAMTPASYRGLGTALFEGGSVVDRLSEIRCPTTILVGSEDLDWLPGAARFAQHLPDAETIVIDGAGHHPHQERPEAWHRAIEAHLRRADRSRSQAGGGRMSLQAGHVGIETASGGTMGAYWARPEGKGPFPAVLVFMEIFGVNDHIRDVARRVAAEGYLALAPDFFHRTGPGLELGYDEAGMAEGMKHLGRLEAEQMIADARDAIAWLRRRDDVVGDRIGAMGFCIGGHMTYLTACETDIVAAAAYYGGGIAAPQGPGGGPSTLSRTPGIRGRIECYFGGRDAMIPIAQVDAIRSALAQAGVEHEVVVYDEADHGFHCDQRGTYHEASARDAWRRTLALFDATLRR